MMSGSLKRLKRNGSIASSVSGPPSWKSTTPTRRVGLTIPPAFLEEKGCYSKIKRAVNVLSGAGRNFLIAENTEGPPRGTFLCALCVLGKTRQEHSAVSSMGSVVLTILAMNLNLLPNLDTHQISPYLEWA